jgi:hypothetical protein
VTSRAQRRHQRRGRRRAAIVVVAALVAAATASVAALLSIGGHGTSSPARRARSAAATTTTTTTTIPPTTTTIDAGMLPQTMEQPTTADPQFQADLAGFWRAVVTDDPTPAMPLFFPLSAYIQVKAISDPASDWNQRLVAHYQQDIHALHASLGPAASTAQLTGIDVPGNVQWIQPGVEYNKGSYWRVEGSQGHYTVGGRAGSFPIASMISWRGHWYIVHLTRIA